MKNDGIFLAISKHNDFSADSSLYVLPRGNSVINYTRNTKHYIDAVKITTFFLMLNIAWFGANFDMAIIVSQRLFTAGRN